MAGYDRTTAEGRRFWAQIEELKKLEVRVGYQAGEATAQKRTKDGTVETETDILDVAMWNELGTVGMPARPFLRQSVDENEGKIAAFCKSSVKKVAEGGTAESCLQAVGVFAKGLVQEKIESGSFEPNAASTVKKKGSDKPLIDTGRLRQSVNFTIKPKGGR